MSRILFIRSTPYDEDMNSYNVQGSGIAMAFCRLGHDCDYLNFHKTKEEIRILYENNGHKARLILKNRFRLFRTGICLEILKEEFLCNYDIVICREYNQIMTHLIAKRHKNTSMYSGPYWNMFMFKPFSIVYDAFFTNKLNNELRCKFVKSQLAKQYLEKKGYTELIDVGVGLDITRFKGVECNDNTLELVDYMKENRCLLYVGTLDSNKNIPFIIEVFDKILQKDPDIKLVLIGKSKQSLFNKLRGKSNESYYADLIKMVPQKVRKKIIHVNRVDNSQLQFIYPLAKAFILPSIHEIFGMVMLEAMYFGAPVITSLNGGSSTLIKNNFFGQLIEEYDADLWSRGVIKYLEDIDYTKKVISNCKKMIREKYTWDNICMKMLLEIEKR